MINSDHTADSDHTDSDHTADRTVDFVVGTELSQSLVSRFVRKFDCNFGLRCCYSMRMKSTSRRDRQNRSNR